MRHKITLFILLFQTILIAQKDIDSIQKLDEIIIDSKRITLPFKENSHTIEVMDSIEMLAYSSTNLDELLQNITGLDVRRRGVEGTQSDMYIRGGNFEQILILIDGIKMDDLQTGHHNMNAIIDPENIERIEIIKGAASRIYGQNAMNGAINIITKKVKNPEGFIRLNAGSFETYGVSMGYATKLNDGSIQFSVNKLKSDGYRYNTDFNNWNGFFKVEFGKNEILATYGERAFGANGFYASPLYTDQYEETQTHLLAFKRNLNFKNIKSNANVYWRRNEDFYLLKRNQPDFYKNKHTTQKIGIEWNGSYNYQWLTSALGIDINVGDIKSSNLGMHERLTATLFLEQRVKTNNGIFDITPGFSVNYYSDFGWYVYPGLDLGAKVNENVKIYSNLGYSSRIPNFTNLYYNSSVEQGNPLLKPEKAFTGEFGIYYNPKDWFFNANYFKRYANDLIDWSKDSINAPKWKAENFNSVITKGIEFSAKYKFNIKSYTQFTKLGYSYMNEKTNESQPIITRYSLNSFKHQIVATWLGQFSKHISQNITFRLVERTSGETYNIADIGLNWNNKSWSVGLDFNNIFNTQYSETNLVPMPKFNVIGNLKYRFK